MKVFISHSREDNLLVEKIVDIFKTYGVEYWIDTEQVDDGSLMNQEINEGLKSCNVFLLIWSINVEKSNWVAAEISSALDPNEPLFENVCIFKIDETRTYFPIHGRKWTRVRDNNLESETKQLINKFGKIESQIILFKEQVVYDYKNYIQGESFKPIISDFKKFNGYKQFVPPFLKSVSSVEVQTPENDTVYVSIDEEPYETVTNLVNRLDETRRDLSTYLSAISLEDIYEWMTRINTPDQLTNTKLKNKYNLTLVVGDYGSGKSGLTHRILYQLCEQITDEVIPLFISLGRLKTYHVEGNNLFEEFCDYIKTEYHFNIKNLEIVELVKKGKIILIIDALDELTHKLDHTIAQCNLENLLNLSAVVPIFLTSRYTYISQGIPRTLVTHSSMFQILDFNKEQIEHFLGLKFSGDETKRKEISAKINSDHFLESIVKKPLFLSIFCDNFEIIKNLEFINEAVLFRIFTKEWIKHENGKSTSIIKPESPTEEINQRCSERLAMVEFTSNKPVTLLKIKEMIEDEFKYESANTENEFESYTRYARDCTFLTVEESDSFRFLLKSFLEFFVASRIVRDIVKYPKKRSVDNITLNLSAEVFHFMDAIIQLDWLIKPRALKQISIIDNETVRHYLNFSENIIKIMDDHRNKRNVNLRNIIQLLSITGNLSPGTDLSNLNLDGLVYPNLNLSHSNLENTSIRNGKLNGINLDQSNLKGANLTKTDLSTANLSQAKLNRANLTGCVLQRANLSGASMISVVCQDTDFTLANLSGCNLSDSSIYSSKFIESNAVATDFTGSGISKTNFFASNLTRAEFADIKFGADNQFEGANLFQTKFVRANQIPIKESEISKRGGFVFK